MRRTVFVVPRELVPVVDAAASRAVAANERERELREVRVGERPGRRPGCLGRRLVGRGARRPRNASLDERAGRRPSTPRATAQAGDRHRVGGRVGGGRRPAAARGGGEDRARPPPRRLDREPVPLDPDRAAGPARAGRPAGGTHAPARPVAAGVRPGHRGGHPLVDGLDRARHPGLRLPLCLIRRSRWRGARATSSRTTSNRSSPAGLPPGRCAAPGTRSDDNGLEGARVVPRATCEVALRPERQRRSDRVVGGARRRRMVTAEGRGDRLPPARGHRRRRRGGRRLRGGEPRRLARRRPHHAPVRTPLERDLAA